MPLVWSHLGKRRYRPWWFAPLRYDRAGSKWYVYTGPVYCEVYRKGPGGTFATLAEVLTLPKGSAATSVNWEKAIMGFFDKLPSNNGTGTAENLPADSMFQKDYPALWQFLTALEYAPGQPRERSSLTVFVEEGAFKLCLSERTKNCSCWATGPTFLDALEALEKRVTSATPEWRSSAKGRRKR